MFSTNLDVIFGMFFMFRRPDERTPEAVGTFNPDPLPVGDTRSRRMFRFSLVWLLVVLGIVISITGSRLVWIWEQERHLTRMEKTIRSYTGSLEEALTRDLDVLRAFEAFFASSNYVDRDEFDTFSAGFLNRYPGIQALEWIPRVPAAERRDYEQRARKDGLEDFRIVERNAQEAMVPAAEREEYFPVYYVNPLEGNRRALGFDLGSNPERLAALGKARDSGQITVSAPIRLVQKTGDQYGFLTFLPLYRKGLPHDTTERRQRNLVGFVLGVYQVGDVLEGALAKQALPGGFDIYLFDDSVPSGSQGIYFHPSRIRTTAVQAEPEDEILGVGYPTAVFPVGDRQWSIVYRHVPGHETQDSTWVPWATLFIGLLFTGFMAVLFTMVFSREARTAALVEERTKDLRDSGVRIRAVLENAVDGIITIDARGIIETFNPAAERTFGYPGDEVVGRNVKLLMPAPFREDHDGYLRNYLETGDNKIIGIGREVVGLRKDGSTFPMDLAVSEMEISGQRMFVGIVRDITERKQVDRMKNEFISTVSHELRTPLTSIQGSLALIDKTRPEGLPEKHVRLLGIAHKNCVRLVRLINDILDIEKIESGRIEFDLSALELSPLVRQAIEANQAFADQFSVSLVLARDLPGAMVHADGDRITQVLTNLLSNAAKFSPEGGAVEVSLARRDDGVRVEVADHGDGIPEEFRERIFSKFAQADASSTRKRQGTGLGLSIAKAIVDKHDGRIGFDTETGAGTTFFFELPEWRPGGNDGRPR